GKPVIINGDGRTSRDFCHVSNVVQVNILAALTDDPAAVNQVYNVALGRQTSLIQLYETLRDALTAHVEGLSIAAPIHADFRPGDIRHSVADISRSVSLLGYAPTLGFEDGIAEAMDWYAAQQKRT